MKDSISRWSLHYEGWAAEHNISCLPRGNRSRGKGLSLLSPCRGGAPPFSPALPSYSVSLLFLLFAPAVTKPHSGRFSSAFRPFCSANPAAGSRNMHKHKNAHYFEKIGGRKRRPYSYIYCIFLQTGKRAVVKTDHVLVPDMELGNEVVGYMGITSATIVTQERLRCTLSRRRRC